MSTKVHFRLPGLLGLRSAAAWGGLAWFAVAAAAPNVLAQESIDVGSDQVELAPVDVGGLSSSATGEDRAPTLSSQKTVDKGKLSTEKSIRDLRDVFSDGEGEPTEGPAEGAEPASLPTGEAKSGVSGTAISAPKGAGTIQGMGESYSAQQSTGQLSYSVPFVLPEARGGSQPGLGLSYSSAGGFGLAGVGWSVGAPFIARETDHGLPKYDDRPNWHPDQDRFVYSGGQELVPICRVGFDCDGRILADEEFPAWAHGSQYFRPRIEGSFERFFLAEDKLTWRVQSQAGTVLEFGVPLNERGYRNALEVNPDRPNEVYRWCLVRSYDAFGNANPDSPTSVPTPNNPVVYRYEQFGGIAHLTAIYDTPPVADPHTTNLELFAHKVELTWQDRPDVSYSYRSGWYMEHLKRLDGVEVFSKRFNDGASDPFERIRRYYLTYEDQDGDSDNPHQSLLTAVQAEGRCDTNGCPRLPPMTFEYERVEGYDTAGNADSTAIPGYEPFDARIRTIAGSPKYSVDQALTDLFDINSDALPDILVTAPGLFGGKHAVYFNGAGTGGLDVGFFSQSTMSVNDPDVPAVDANVLGLDNANVVPMDLDADGTVDLVHMPRVKSYSVFTPKYAPGQGWQWDGRPITTADQQDPKIDFANDNANIRSVDVDYDGLVDIVVTTGTEVQTFFSLGRFPGGDGQFGSGVRTSAATAELSTDPVRSCVPWSGSPVRFSDSDIRLADMNGDGAVDIVRVRPNDVRYWPGRGNGFWGTGDRDDCGPGTFGQDRHITLSNPPQYGLLGDGLLMLDDVNGDGLTDLVEVKNSDVDVYLNIDGLGFTDRQTIANTPVKPATSNRVRLADINGSGTRDVLWGDGYEYKFMDLQGGKRPWVLTAVENGLGKRTEMEWSTSVDEMLEAERDPTRPKWEHGMPVVVHVIKRIHERSPLSIVGQPATHYVSEYSYEDPVFDGQQREFRGFTRGRQRRLGDANSPTDTVETTFLLGECIDEDATDGLERCGPEGRWLENPREALKGLPIVTESYDEKGVYLRTQVTSYRLRTLYEGVDGRMVKWTYAHDNHSFLYDTSPFRPDASATHNLTVVELEPGDGSLTPEQTLVVPLRSTTGTVHVTGFNEADYYGNPTLNVSVGCVEGCATPEERLETHTEWRWTPNDPSRWLRRASHSYVTGSEHAGRRNEIWTEHNVQGLAVRSTASLWGSEPLLRYHEDPVQDAVVKAATPASAAGGVGTSTTIEVDRTTYNAFGNGVRTSGRNGRCTEVSYDPTYGELAISETIFVHGCDSPDPLVLGATYDRGLQVPVLTVDVQGQPSRAEYDGLGRLVSMTPPAPEGGLAPLPNVVMEYFLPPDTGHQYSLIHTRALDGASPADAEYMESWAYVDGLGRVFLTLAEADPTAGDKGEWIAGGLMEWDQKSGARRAYLPFFYTGDPKMFPFGNVPEVPFGRKRYDAFGRGIQYYDQDGTVTLETKYHALASDHYDAADRLPGPHQGTFMTEEIDGHGRSARVVERFRQKGVLRERVTQTEFIPTGEAERITRRLDGVPGAETTRWMRYDSLGRMVLNMEPTTSPDFTPDKGADTTGLRAWRYRFNDAGDLVGTSDPRGCGSNFHYDGAGRLIGEDYVPCQNIHAPYTPPVSLNQPTGFEVYTLFDAAPETPFPGVTRPIPAADVNPAYYRGRPAAVFDRGAARWATYDGRGRSPKSYVQVARPDAPQNASIAERYAPRWYTTEATFDGADRVVSATTGARSPDLMGADGQSRVDTHYTRRGIVQRSDGSYGLLTHSAVFEADGRLTQVKYGDAADTRTSFLYDERRRVRSVQTYRGPPPVWDTYADPDTDPDRQNPTSFQLLLQDTDYQYDVVGNPTEIRDWRLPEEWPGGAQPVTQKVTYDDLYRATRVDYQHPEGRDTWTSPFDHENAGDNDDTRRSKPAPHVAFDTRAEWQTYEFDWLGNITKSEDDGHGFYDRSLGEQQHGSVGTQPYQLRSASNVGGGVPQREGRLDTSYDAVGNLTGLAVERFGPCLPAGASCNQRFAYEWDEVGRLSRARRWDVPSGEVGSASDALPPGLAEVDLRYTYDGGDSRVVKTANDGNGEERHTVYIFGSLELRGARWLDATLSEPADYELTELTEVPFLFGAGRVVFEPDSKDVPTIGGARLHVFLDIGDNLGSSSVVLDKATGELVEHSTYLAYGSADADYRPTRWKGFREDYKFTGKEEDVEVGLVYFGARYYSPQLSRWVSPDPLEVHSGGADPNLYAYVSGSPLKNIDPLGLQGETSDSQQDAAHRQFQAEHQAYTQYQDRLVAANDAVERGEVGAKQLLETLLANPVPPPGTRPSPQVEAKPGQVAGKAAPQRSTASMAISATEEALHEKYLDTKDEMLSGYNTYVDAGFETVKTAATQPLGIPGEWAGINQKIVPPEVGKGVDSASSTLKSEAVRDGSSGALRGELGATAGMLLAPSAAGKGAAVARAPTASRRILRLLKGCATCFPEGTPVHTPDGLTPIEELQPGDLVLAMDENTGEVGYRPVQNVFITTWRPLIELDLETSNGKRETLKVTDDHPFWVQDEGWLPSAELQAGHKLWNTDGSWISIRSTRSAGWTTVAYNLNVGEYHTFFVGKTGIWVHNAGKKGACARAIQAVKAVHGNSRLSSKAQHVYGIIKRTGSAVVDTLKYGVGDKLRKSDGMSVRAESQVRKLNRAAKPGEVYESVILTHIKSQPGARGIAYDTERVLVYAYDRVIGRKPFGNKLP
ncbi:MAG: hypothetical protein H6716_26410 [Polyangiaceae bacterium]|nr:hypothetical protein [Polyangiaceae bacterium]